MRADAQQNREHLLVTARALVRKGQAPTLNELAREAGVGVGTVYRHFRDSEALMTALVAGPLQELGTVFARASAEPEPEAALRSLFLSVLELQLAHPMVGQLVHAPESTSPTVRAVLAELAAAAEQIVKRARRQKRVRASITGADVCCLLLGVHAAALTADQPKLAARRYAEIVLAGLTPPA